MPAKITFLVALLLLAAAAAPAQTASWMRVTVPFSFVAAGNNCPAGDYTVNIDRETGQVMLNSEPKSAVLITSTDPRPADRRLLILPETIPVLRKPTVEPLFARRAATRPYWKEAQKVLA